MQITQRKYLRDKINGAGWNIRKCVDDAMYGLRNELAHAYYAVFFRKNTAKLKAFVGINALQTNREFCQDLINTGVIERTFPNESPAKVMLDSFRALFKDIIRDDTENPFSEVLKVLEPVFKKLDTIKIDADKTVNDDIDTIMVRTSDADYLLNLIEEFTNTFKARIEEVFEEGKAVVQAWYDTNKGVFHSRRQRG